MKKETLAKIKQTKAENEKKNMDICGYEIWRDLLNFTTVKDGKNLYFSTFKNALIDIRDELVRNKLSESKTLETAISRIEEVDRMFIKALSTSLAVLGREFRQ